MEDKEVTNNGKPYFEMFISRLGQLCDKKGISMTALSYSLGHSHSYLHHIMTSRSKMPINEFFEICDILGVTPNEFFSDEQNPLLINEIRDYISQIDSNHAEKLLKFFKSLSVNEIQSLIDILDKRSN